MKTDDARAVEAFARCTQRLMVSMAEVEAAADRMGKAIREAFMTEGDRLREAVREARKRGTGDRM